MAHCGICNMRKACREEMAICQYLKENKPLPEHMVKKTVVLVLATKTGQYLASNFNRIPSIEGAAIFELKDKLIAAETAVDAQKLLGEDIVVKRIKLPVTAVINPIKMTKDIMMTDDPTTCPKCGARTDLIEVRKDHNLEKCLSCKQFYNVWY